MKRHDKYDFLVLIIAILVLLFKTNPHPAPALFFVIIYQKSIAFYRKMCYTIIKYQAPYLLIGGMDMNQNNQEENRQQHSMTLARLAIALANDYETVYVINTEDDSYIEYGVVPNSQELTRRSSGQDFYADTPVNAKLLVHPDDQAHFVAALEKETMRETLRTDKSFLVHYRLILGGVPRYYVLKGIKDPNIDGRFIMIGVKNVDEQTRKELAAEAESRTYSEIAGSLASLYEVIYHIDVRTGHYKVYGCAPDLMNNNLRTGSGNFFELLSGTIRAVIHPDDAEMVFKALYR